MKQFSLRNRLYVLILILLIPLLLLHFLAILSRYNQAVHAELDASLDFANAANIAFQNYLRDLWNTEYSIALALSGGNRFTSPEQIEKYMKEVARLYPAVDGLIWLDGNYTTLASTIPSIKRGASLADRRYLKQIFYGNDQVVSELVVEGETICLPVSQALRDNHDKLLGIVVAIVDVSRMNEIIPIQRNDEQGAFGFLDRKGVIVFHSLKKDLSMEERVLQDGSPVSPAFHGITSVSHKYYSSLTEDYRMGVYIPMSPLGWVTFVTSSRRVVLGEVINDTIRDIIIMMAVAIASFIIALRVGSRLLKPIQVLQQTAQAISQGELAARTLIQGSDEFAVTGQIFDEMAERIQQLEISRTRFLQTAAHELRNPMAGIKGLLSLVRRRLTQGKPLGDITQMLEVMDREIDRLSNLLNQIIEAFRTQRDQAQLSLILKPVNLVDVVFATLKPFQLTVHQCQFIREIDTSSEIWVIGDSARLEEVIRNLLSNAVKYSPNGGKITILLTTENGNAIMAIKDQGIGIPQEQVGRIFDCFYRASNLEKRDPGGMGLGLYICKEIIEGHDGTIWAESEEGIGSSFFIKLPLYKNREEV